MAIPPRLAPLLAQFDFTRQRLTERMTGPGSDSGNGTPVPVPAMTDDEYLWEPVPDCWSVRPRAHGPGARATVLVGAGEWGRDAVSEDQPWPPPFTTIAWRLSHLSEMLARRADYTVGSHGLTRDDYPAHGDAAGAVEAFDRAAADWRAALLAADDAALDTVGHCVYPGGSDAEELFLDLVWWVNQELLHHGAEIALLRDLYRSRAAGA